MASRDEQGRNPQGDLESPFLEEEIFVGETETDWEAHLTALEAESPFRQAFEQSPAMPFKSEESDEEFIEEEEWSGSEDFLLDESEVFDDELLANLEENIEESDEDESYDEEFDDEDEELRYADREGVDLSDEDLFLDEQAASPEELLTEVQEGEGSDDLDEVTDVQEAPAFDESFFPELEEEQAKGAVALRARIVEVAKQEWEKWGRGSKTETQSEMKEVLRNYWRTVWSEKSAEEAIGRRSPWSAAFISWVMQEANAGDAFENSSLHTVYVDAAKQAYTTRDTSRFWAYQITEKKPESGDLVIKDRCSRREQKKCVGCFNTNYENIGDRNNKGYLYRKSHGDIVVSIDQARKRIRVIGGNVGHSVREKWIDLDPQGYLPERASDGCQYIAILKPPDVERPISVPSSSAGSGNLLPTWLSEIVKRGRLTLQAASAMLTGQRDVNTLTNMVFYAHHPHLPVGYKIKPHEKQLAESWVRIREDVVKPLLGKLATGNAASVSAPLASSTAPSSAVPSPIPGEIPSRLGTLVLRRNGKTVFRYEFTPDDLLWTARLISGEAGARDDLENRAVIAAMLNRFALFTHRVYPTFTNFIRAYSTPLQPVLRNKKVAQHYMNDPRFRRRGGTYKGTTIPRGQLQHHLDLQGTPWGRLRPLARKIALEALMGQMPDTGIGLASEFASTWILYGRRVGPKNRTEAGWLEYTQKFKRDKGHWIGHKSNLDQKRNAFFIDRRATNLPPDSLQVVPPT